MDRAKENRRVVGPAALVFALLTILEDTSITHSHLHVIGKIAPFSMHPDRTWNRTLRFHWAILGACPAVLAPLIILDNIIVSDFHSLV